MSVQFLDGPRYRDICSLPRDTAGSVLELTIRHIFVENVSQIHSFDRNGIHIFQLTATPIIAHASRSSASAPLGYRYPYLSA